MTTADGGQLARLGAAVPASVVEVCAVLARAGHQAVTVGGAVRDALRGFSPGDWDVATSASPEEVMRQFPRTIPTGVQHGTVTVIVGRGTTRIHVEVTSFRGEGAYSDARRPDAVRFGVPLEEDLARRDFVINAMAFDPMESTLVDPFGGRADLEARLLRAVGDPAARFREDGLRVMRALRFVAQLDFVLEPATAAAIPAALDALDRVSRERVRVELGKLLAGPAAGRALVLAADLGVLARVLPEGASAAAIKRALAAPTVPVVELAALLLDAGPDVASSALRRLTFSNVDREMVVKLVRAASRLAASPDRPAMRRALAEVGRPAAEQLSALLRACGRMDDAAQVTVVAAAGDPLGASDLALRGGELIAALGLTPGPIVGALTAYLVGRVLDEPADNTRERLVALARAELARGGLPGASGRLD